MPSRPTWGSGPGFSCLFCLSRMSSCSVFPECPLVLSFQNVLLKIVTLDGDDLVVDGGDDPGPYAHGHGSEGHGSEGSDGSAGSDGSEGSDRRL